MLTYPVPQLAGQGSHGINVGYGPMALGPRWLAYASNSPMVSNNGRVSFQNLSPSPGVSPSTSPSGGSLMARYAMESSKQLASGIINLGDLGYKTLSKYCQELLPDGSNSPVSPSSGWKVGGRLAGTEIDNAGMVGILVLYTRHFVFYIGNRIWFCCINRFGVQYFMLIVLLFYTKSIFAFCFVDEYVYAGFTRNFFQNTCQRCICYSIEQKSKYFLVHVSVPRCKNALSFLLCA